MWENFKSIFTNFSAFNAIEIIMCAVVLYYAFKIMRSNNAKILIYVSSIFMVLSGVLFLADTTVSNKFFVLIPIAIFILVALIFNTEVKRDLWKLAKGKGDYVQDTEAYNSVIDDCITNIIKAVQNMSKNNVGALIILSNGNLSKQILESGVAIDAKITSQLIEGTFFPHSPLHDGAMIINGHRVEAAGCFLPLTQKANLPKELGTRHRAGIGISEISDVTAIIVSEETGIVSMARRGVITRYVDFNGLKDALNSYYWKELAV